MIYGGFELRLGDSDADQKWGGRRLGSMPATAASGPSNALRPPSPVADLQRDLRTLGFLLGPTPSGIFDSLTKQAVREFQIYAKMEQVAREDTSSSATEYVDRLGPVVTGAHRYAGPVSGVASAETRSAIKHWLEESWRCPVVLDAWNQAKPPARVKRNVWRHDEMVAGVVRIRDFSDRYRPQEPTDVWLLGWRGTYKTNVGPSNTSAQSLPEAEVLPETLIGRDWIYLDDAERSTFKVVRVVAELECYGFFDVVNAYDGAVVSTGIFHFTLQKNARGELAGLLGQWADEHGGDFESAFGAFGLNVKRSPTGSPGAAIGLEDENGQFEPIGTDFDYLRNWHWFYRWVMAGRTVRSYREQMWKAALERIWKIRNAAFDVAEAAVSAGPHALAATLGDVFTSELAIAYLLRWHVNRPADIVKDGTHVGHTVENALKDAKKAQPSLNWAAHPSQWEQPHEDALVAALKALHKPNAELEKTLAEVEKFPTAKKEWQLDRTEVTALSTTRNSFKFALTLWKPFLKPPWAPHILPGLTLDPG